VGDNRAMQVNKAFSLIVNSLLFIEALLTTIAIPQFEGILNGLEKEIPLITKIIFLSPVYIWLLPIFGIFFYIKNIKNYKGAGYGYIATFIAGILWLPLAIYGLYLPML